MIVQLHIHNLQKEEVFHRSFVEFGATSLSLTQSRTLFQVLPSLMRILELTRTDHSLYRHFHVSGVKVSILADKGLYVVLVLPVEEDHRVYKGFAEKVLEFAWLSTQNRPHFRLHSNSFFSRSVGAMYEEQQQSILEEAVKKRRSSSRAWTELVNTIDRVEGTEVGKYVFAGPAAAGKSSIIAQFFQNWSTQQIRNIKPTIFRSSASHKDEFTQTSFSVLDLGGQVSYIPRHLQDPLTFINVGTLFFVIDLQSSAEMGPVQQYLKAIVEKLKELSQSPSLTILLHKFDPGMEAELAGGVSFWFEWLHTYLSQEELEFSIYLTSIHDDSSREAMARSLLFSLPQWYLNLTIENEVITKAVNSLYPIITQMQEELSQMDQLRVEKELFDNSIPFGVEAAKSVVDQWVRYLVNRSHGEPGPLDSTDPPEKDRVRLQLVKVEQLLRIHIKCPLSDTFFHDRYKPICGVTKGVIEGLGRSLGLGDVRVVQTQIRNHSDYCTFEVGL